MQPEGRCFSPREGGAGEVTGSYMTPRAANPIPFGVAREPTQATGRPRRRHARYIIFWGTFEFCEAGRHMRVSVRT